MALVVDTNPSIFSLTNPMHQLTFLWFGNVAFNISNRGIFQVPRLILNAIDGIGHHQLTVATSASASTLAINGISNRC
jgi:hypothetical protein